jgi:hypothetical protein
MLTQRVLAIVFSVVGVGWGLFCLPLVFSSFYGLILFGPGYIVTAGYVARACLELSWGVRVGIWWLSALVQGAWLIWALCGISQGAWFRGFAFEWVTLVWWACAFVASMFGALSEPNLATTGAGDLRRDKNN